MTITITIPDNYAPKLTKAFKDVYGLASKEALMNMIRGAVTDCERREKRSQIDADVDAYMANIAFSVKT